jgi:hypothetical protein
LPYPRENTIQVSAISSAGGAATVKLPNATTGTLPADQTGKINPIGSSSRWRIRSLLASFSAAPASGSTLQIADGVFTWTIDLNSATPLWLAPLDVQCAAGAEVDITLSAGGGAIVGHLNLSVVSEG